MLIIALVLMVLGKRIGLKDRILIGQTVNSSSLEGLVKLARKIIKYTLTFEIIGAIFIATVFVPIYGWSDGLFKSIFQSISAFCNAGFDVVGNTSMMQFATNRTVSITCMALTTIAGLGFLVWDNISNCIHEGIEQKYSVIRIIKKFNLHTKVVLMMQMLLFVIGTIAFLGFEFNNNNTIGQFNLSDKMLISAFHSISFRTAGFASVSMPMLTDISKTIFSIFMLIGAGSGSMAGGIKTTTLFVVLAGVYSNIIGRKNICVFKRTIPMETFIKAVSVFVIAIVLLLISNIILMANSNINSLDLLFESVSALATVGVSSGALLEMNILCKWVLIVLMYIGRIGTVTMAVSFVVKKPKMVDQIVYSKEEIIVG